MLQRIQIYYVHNLNLFAFSCPPNSYSFLIGTTPDSDPRTGLHIRQSLSLRGDAVQVSRAQTAESLEVPPTEVLLTDKLFWSPKMTTKLDLMSAYILKVGKQ